MSEPIDIESSVVVVTQPEFFSRHEFPERPDLVETVRAYNRHTGSTVVGRDEELAQRIIADLLLGRSTRQIAADHRVSRNTIAGIYAELDSAGKVEPLKQRLASLVGRVCLMGLEDYAQAVSEGRIHPSQLPIPLGIFLDKRELLGGDSSVRAAEKRPAHLTIDAVKEFFLGPAAPDNVSSADGGKAQ